MTPRLPLKRQTFTQVSPKEIKSARTDPAVLKDLVSSPQRRRTGLGIYWHAVPYLLTGLAQNIDEPYRWFIDGGETLGKNDAGNIRYLSPDQAMALAAALEDESPDELGQLTFDEAKMDRHGIYPSRWVAWSDNDNLGTMRELYSYVRELIASSSKQTGLLIHLESETVDDDAPEPTTETRAGAPQAPTLKGKLLFTAAEDNRYHEADASTHPKASVGILRDIDSEMKASGYSVTGDFTTSTQPGDTIRCFISTDRTVIAIKYISTYAVGGYRFFSRLDSGALIVSSDAFIREAKKVNYFADFLQNQAPGALHAAVLARRAKLEKKHGKPMVLSADLITAARLWEEQNTRLAGVR